MSAVLIIAEPSTAQARATELRMMGYPTWTATTEADVRWLHDQAWIRPAFAVVDTRVETGDRHALLTALARLAASTNLPSLVIGADEKESRLFRDVIAHYPADVDVQTLLDRLHAAAA